MSKPLKIKISVPNPCSEDWDKMEPKGEGRFCSRCTNIIRDFSTFTDRELVEFLSKTKGKVCGQFANTQLNRLIVVTEPSNTPMFRRLLFGAALTAGVAGTVHGQSTAPSTTDSTTRSGITTTSSSNASGNINKTNVPGTNKSNADDTSGIISGRITDAKTKHPLADAKLIVELDSVHYATAYTDSTGHYSVHIPTSYLNKQIILFPRMEDYDNASKTVVITKFPAKFNFGLHKSKFDYGKTKGYMMM